MLQKFERVFPARMRLPILLALACNLLVYYSAKMIISGATPVNMTLPLDARIPLLTPFILIYVLAYFQWVLGYVVAGHESTRLCREACTAAICAKLLCLICFIALPTALERPVIEGKGIFQWMTRVIYSADVPNCLFPSIHCLESWLVFRIAIGMKKMPKWYAPAMGVFSVLVMLSTIFVKQHLVLDIPAGILAAEIGLFLSKKFKLYRVFGSKGEAE